MTSTLSNSSRPLMTEKGAAIYLSMAVPTLRKWRVQGGGPAFCKLGKAVRYDMADLDDWIAERRFASTSAMAGVRP